MIFLHWLPVLAQLTLAAPAPRVAPQPTSFSAWFNARVAEEKPKVQVRYQVDLDADGRDDEVACYVFNEGPAAGIPITLVGLARGERFALGQGDVASPGCPSPPERGSDLSQALQLKHRTMTNGAELSLLVDRYGPMLLRSSGSGPECTRLTELRTVTSKLVCSPQDSDKDIESAEPLVVISDATPVELPTGVSAGKEFREGHGDADMKVSLRRRGSVLTVVARLTDDKTVLAKDTQPEAVLAADHLELRWSDGDAPSGGVRLAIARTLKGTPTAIWLDPPRHKQPPPVLRWTRPERVEVELPLSWLLLERTSEVGNLHVVLTQGSPDLSVAFFDSDGEGQATTVTGYSRFFVVERGRRFPALSRSLVPWQSVGKEATLLGLVQSLYPWVQSQTEQ